MQSDSDIKHNKPPVCVGIRPPAFSNLPSISLPSVNDPFTYRKNQKTERSGLNNYVDDVVDTDFSDTLKLE